MAEIKASLPELLDEKRARWHSDFGLPFETIDVLIQDRETAEYTEEYIRKRVEVKDPQLVSKYFVDQGEIRAKLNAKESKLLSQCALQVANMARNVVIHAAKVHDMPVPEVMKIADVPGLLELVSLGTISLNQANTAIEKSAASVTSFLPAQEAITKFGLEQITDTGAIEAEVDKVIASAPEQVADFQGGNEKVLGWFVGQIMKATQGKANPATVNEILRKKLSD